MALLTFTFRSDELKKDTLVQMVIPDPRDGLTKPLAEYPVVYMLHGLGNDATCWVRKTNAERHAAARGLVLVMPSVERSMYCDGVLGQNFLRYVTIELPRYLNLVFGLSRAKNQNFVMGLSMGGLGAAKAALTYPNHYAAWASMSGVLDMTPLFEHMDDAMAEEFSFTVKPGETIENTISSAANLIDKKKQGELPGYVSCGLNDPYLLCTQMFEEKAKAAGLNIQYYYHPTYAHVWDFWEEELPKIFDLFLAWKER